MALATKCPHCNTIFRVAHDQLKLRGGIVRCGACNEVFDGNAALVEPQARAPLPSPAAAPPVPAPYIPEAPLAAALPQATPFDDKMVALDARAAEVLQAEPAEAVYALELDTAVDDAAAAAVAGSGAASFDTAQAPADQAAELPATATTPAAAPAPYGEELPVPASGGDDKLELDLDVDIEPEVELELEVEVEVEPEVELAAADINTEIELDEAELPPADTIIDSAADPLADPIEETAAIDHAAPSPDMAALEIEAMSDAELAVALEAELAALEADAVTEAAIKPEPAPADERREPTFGVPPAEAIAAAAVSDGRRGDFDEMDVDEEALLQLSSAGVAASHAASSAAPMAAAAHRALVDAVASDEQEEPGFVKRDRLRRRFGRAATIGMSLGSVLLLAALLGQGIATFRNQLAASVPKLKPVLVSACATLGCKVELPTQIDDVSIEQGELQTLSETTFSFTTLLRNQSSTAQTWPHIELILDDASDKAVLRRVFTPREYLGPDVALDKGFAPHTEQSVKLYFELGQLKASGYHIAVFYP